MRVAKTKALISFAVTAKLICLFVFTYAKSRFSHDAAQITKTNQAKKAQNGRKERTANCICNLQNKYTCSLKVHC